MLFTGAAGKTGEQLTTWFDEATATLGGRDVLETVRDMLGNVSHFDFQQVGGEVPRVDLPDLERFFTLSIGRHRRRILRHQEGMELKAPDAWKERSYAVRLRYEGLVFDRGLRGRNAAPACWVSATISSTSHLTSVGNFRPGPQHWTESPLRF